MDYLKDGLAAIFFAVILLILGNMWGVQSERQDQAQHAKIVQYKAELKGKTE